MQILLRVMSNYVRGIFLLCCCFSAYLSVSISCLALNKKYASTPYRGNRKFVPLFSGGFKGAGGGHDPRRLANRPSGLLHDN